MMANDPTAPAVPASPPPPAAPPPESNDRAVRLRSVVADCLARRSSGESLLDHAVIQSHPDLMPELGDRLKQLGLAFMARREAVSASPILTDGSSHAGARGMAGETSADVGATQRARLAALTGYQIIGELSRGGQGVVYKAVQRSTRRMVAIKVLRQNPLGGDDGRARFEREVRVLAQLHHPNIVAVHESGTVGDDLCYFVMDFVPGAPLDRYVEQRVALGRGVGAADIDAAHARKPRQRFTPAGMTLRDAVRLFQKTSDAVHAAHLRGIIHRDLKPGNIRVDDAGEPHVLDFGLAKPVDSASADGDDSGAAAFSDVTQAPHTITGQFLGSMPWASPEQAEGDPDLIDLRSDVYSLGVMFFQTLTGMFPYPVMGRQQDVLTHIRETPPKRPSTLTAGLDAEIETIVLKCLSKERDRRYQSAGEFARDLERYLKGQVIEARRDSVAYVIGKQLRRHRTAVVVAAAFLLVIVVGLAVSAWQWRVAAKQANRATAVGDFLSDMLESVNPRNSFDPDVRVRRILDVAATNLATGAHPPEVRAELHAVLGRTYRSLGQFALAESHLRDADALLREVYGPTGEQLAMTRSFLGLVLVDQRRLKEAEPILRDAMEMSRGAHGADTADVSVKMCNLGNALFELKQFDEAERMYRQALDIQRRELGRTHPEVAVTLNDLALVLQQTERTSEARDCLTEAMAILREHHKGDHPHVAVTLMHLGDIEDALDHADQAEKHFVDAERMWRAITDGNHPSLAIVLSRRGVLAAGQGDVATAQKLLEESLRIRRSVLASDHPLIADTLYKLGQAQSRGEDLKLAEATLRDALAAYEALPDDYELNRIRVLNSLAVLARRQGNWAETEKSCRQLLPRVRPFAATEPEALVAVLHNLGHALSALDRDEEAATFLAEALQVLRSSLPGNKPELLRVLKRLGDAMLSLKRPEEACKYFAELLALRRELKSEPDDMLEALRDLTTSTLAVKRFAEAEALARETLDVAGETWKDDDPQRLYVVAIIGDSLRGQARYAEAEKILLDAYTRLDKPGMAMQIRDLYVAKKIDLLYQEWGKADEVKAWRGRLTQPPG